MRVIFTILLTLLISNSTWASIISLSTTGTAAINKGQSEQVTIDYLKINLYRKLINLSVTYLKESPELTNKNYTDDEIKDLAAAVTKISFSDIKISKSNASTNLSMTLTVYIDTDTINRFIPQSLENNQFKAFAKHLYNDLIVIETNLLTSQSDTEPYLLIKVDELFHIQRNKAYEMNQLALSGYLDTNFNDGSVASKRKLAMKESNINAILEDINNYNEILVASINQKINDAIDLSKIAVTKIKTYGNTVAAEPIIFNDLQTYDLISAKNESISIRKEIITFIKTFNIYNNDISTDLINSLTNIRKQIEFTNLYELKPMRAKWEASYQYEFRLSNYNKRLEQLQPLYNINISRINFIQTKALLEIEIINYLSLLKISSPFETYLKALQNGQYLGPEISQAYIMNISELNISKSKITLPFTVRYEGEEYIFNLNLTDFDQDKIIYLIENPNRFSVAPTFRLSSSGQTPYDVTQVQSGFSIYHRTDNFFEIFTTDNTFIPFPENNLSYRLKAEIQLKTEELNNLIDEEKDNDLTGISHSFDSNYNELKLSDLTTVQATEEQILSLPKIEQIIVDPIIIKESDINLSNDNIPEETNQDNVIKEDAVQQKTTQEKIIQQKTTEEVTVREEIIQHKTISEDIIQDEYTKKEITQPSIITQFEDEMIASPPSGYYEYFDNFSDYNYLFEPTKTNRYYGAILVNLSSKLNSSDFENLGYTLGTIGITGQYQFKIPLALEAQVNFTSFNNGSGDFYLVATKQLDYLLFALFQYPLFLNNLSIIPFIGIGAGVSSVFLDYENENSIDNPIVAKNLTNTTAFLLSTKAGVKIIVDKFIISTGIQINKLRPELLGKLRNMDNYQIFIEAGFSFIK